MKKNIFYILSLLPLFLVGCLKDQNTLDINDNTSRVIAEFVEDDPLELHTIAVPVGPGLVEVDFADIRTVTRSNVTKDVHVTLTLNPALIDQYNADNGTAYTAPPASAVDFSTNSYTLSPSSKTASVKIKIDPSVIDGNEYALGFSITEVTDGEISVLHKDYIAELKIRSPYDGDYTSNGYFYHPTVPRSIDNRPKTLSTLTANAVICELGDLGTSGYEAVLEVDASNNVTISAAPGAAGAPYTMFTALPDTNPGYTPQWPGSAECNNTYDPVEQEFKLRYGYMGSNGWRVTEEIIKRN